MPCYHPITGYRSRYVGPNGKRRIVFNATDGYLDMPVTVACGQCVGCRLEYSRQWAVRCVHEASLHEHNSFITLTYAPEYLPDDNSISKEVLQRFFKRLRKAVGTPLRYFACGEYGESRGRPHYHAIIFGYDFPDKFLYTVTKGGDHLYRSPLLEEVWPFGHSLVGSVTFESAAYVARYAMKKRRGKDKDAIESHYTVVDGETGEVHRVEPEFCLMSRKPGLGRDWLDFYHDDTDKDFITLRGKRMRLPRYYDNILEAEDELSMLERKDKRRKAQSRNREDQTMERLQVRETVKLAQISNLNRGYEQ